MRSHPGVSPRTRSTSIEHVWDRWGRSGVGFWAIAHLGGWNRNDRGEFRRLRQANEGGHGRLAGMGQLDNLLAVQDHDTACDGLRRRRDRLPVRAELAARELEAAALLVTINEVRAERDIVLRREKAFDHEARSLEAKAAEADAVLYSGSITSPKELQALQADVESIRRHRRAVEDDELEVLVEREELDGRVRTLEDELAALSASADELRATLDGQEHEVDSALAEHAASRAELVAELPSSLLALYEKIRLKNNGIGAGKLVGVTCQGCHLVLPTVEVDHARRAPADEVIQSSTCGCILVR